MATATESVFGEPLEHARSVEEILEDMKEEKAAQKARNGGGLFSNMGSNIKARLEQKGKQAVKAATDKAVDVAVDQVKDVALDAITGAATGGAVKASDFKGINSKTIIPKLIGIAGSAAFGVVAKDAVGNLLNSDKKDAASDTLKVPSTDNLDAQQQIAAQNKEAGHKTKMMKYTDDQLSKLDATDQLKLVGREAFIKSPFGYAYQLITANAYANTHGITVSTSVPTKRKTLTPKPEYEDGLFTETPFADAVSTAVESASDAQPKVSEDTKPVDTPKIDPEAEKQARIERARRQAELANEQIKIEEPDNSRDYTPSFGRH